MQDESAVSNATIGDMAGSRYVAQKEEEKDQGHIKFAFDPIVVSKTRRYNL